MHINAVIFRINKKTHAHPAKNKHFEMRSWLWAVFYDCRWFHYDVIIRLTFVSVLHAQGGISLSSKPHFHELLQRVTRKRRKTTPWNYKLKSGRLLDTQSLDDTWTPRLLWYQSETVDFKEHVIERKHVYSNEKTHWLNIISDIFIIFFTVHRPQRIERLEANNITKIMFNNDFLSE